MGSAPSKPTTGATQFEEDEKVSLNQAMGSLNLSPASVDGSLTISNVQSWEKAISADPKAQLSRTVFAHSNIAEALLSRPALVIY